MAQFFAPLARRSVVAALVPASIAAGAADKAAHGRGPILADGAHQQSGSTGWSSSWQWVKPDPQHGGGATLLAPRWPGPASRRSEVSFTRAQVASCDGSDAAPGCRLLVTYRDGVYDVTEYVKEHPGGRFILNAAGGPVDSWWKFWMAHHLSPAVAEALEKLRVGRLVDYQPEADEERTGGGIWAEEQSADGRAENRRRTARISEMPYQSVTTCSELARSFLTHRDALYVRNHAPVPEVALEDAQQHTLTFAVGEDDVGSMTLHELRDRFSTAKVTSVLQCSGNRGADNISANGFRSSGFSGRDDQFLGLGMLGNVEWGGVRLREVLKDMFPQSLSGKDLHVTFEGLDGYYSSTPLDIIMDPERDCLLAMEMNGQALAPDHGFPLRVVLPGIAGARCVKWVTKISVGVESESPWIRHFYRDKPAMTPIQLLPMNSVILSPEPGDHVDAGSTTVTIVGVAYSGGTGRHVVGVQVSADHGQTWQNARCFFEELPLRDERGRSQSRHCWLRFRAEMPLPPVVQEYCGGPLPELWCRAIDEEGIMQPERSDAHGGYLYNGYHKVPIVRR